MDADLVMYVDGEFYSKQKDIETDDGSIFGNILLQCLLMKPH